MLGYRRNWVAAEGMTIEREGTMADSATVAELTARIERRQSERGRATNTLRRLADTKGRRS